MSCMATTTHTMVVKLSRKVSFAHEVVVSRSNGLFLSPRSLSSTSAKSLHGIAWDNLWDRWRVPMYLLSATNCWRGEVKRETNCSETRPLMARVVFAHRPKRTIYGSSKNRTIDTVAIIPNHGCIIRCKHRTLQTHRSNPYVYPPQDIIS
jgi:hypothetical protein